MSRTFVSIWLSPLWLRDKIQELPRGFPLILISPPPWRRLRRLDMGCHFLPRAKCEPFGIVARQLFEDEAGLHQPVEPLVAILIWKREVVVVAKAHAVSAMHLEKTMDRWQQGHKPVFLDIPVFTR